MRTGERIVVVGTSGSGKSTLARELAQKLKIPHIELDELYWNPGWQVSDTNVFQERLKNIVAEDAWVLDGNHGRAAGGIIWKRATRVIWLDYAFSLIFFRAFRRSLVRIWNRQELCNGNKETIRKSFLSRESILLWVLTTYKKRKRDYIAIMTSPEYRHLHIVRLCEPREAEVLLEKAERGASC